MKKILSLTLTLALLGSIISGIPVSAENGYNGLYFYDFEDYTSGQGSGPDSNWTRVVSWMSNFGPTDTND